MRSIDDELDAMNGGAITVDFSKPQLIRERVGDLHGLELDDVEHVIDPLLPRGFVTLFSSHGGGGKSNLSLAWTGHIACGVPWCGLPTQRGRVLYVTLEDPTFIVRFRLKRIAEQYRLSATAIDQGIEIISGSEIVSAALAINASLDGMKSLLLTRIYDEVREAAIGFDLVILDNASDAFHASENARPDVNQFIRTLAIEIGRRPDHLHTAVLLLAHIDKNAARFGGGENDFSGSTAWHNSTRSRIALLPGIDEQSATLVHQKSNFRPRHPDIPLAWVNKVLVPTTAEAVSDAMLRKARTDADAVLAAIQAAIESGREVPVATSGPNTCFKLLQQFPELGNDLRKAGSARVNAAVIQLQRDGLITLEHYRDTSQRKDRTRWTLAQNTTNGGQ